MHRYQRRAMNVTSQRVQLMIAGIVGNNDQLLCVPATTTFFSLTTKLKSLIVVIGHKLVYMWLIDLVTWQECDGISYLSNTNRQKFTETQIYLNQLIIKWCPVESLWIDRERDVGSVGWTWRRQRFNFRFGGNSINSNCGSCQQSGSLLNLNQIISNCSWNYVSAHLAF